MMIRIRTIAAFAALAASALAAGSLFAEKKPFERYQSIIDRHPFGEPPPGFDPMRSPDEVQRGQQANDVELTPDQETLQKSVQFSVINVEPDGSVMVGFTDKTDAKMPRHYYLGVGETRDGWFVKEADPIGATVALVKDEIEISLDLGANSAPSAPAKGGGRSVPGTARPSILNRSEGDALSSFRGRRRARELREAEDQAERERIKAEAEARRAEEQAAREQEKAEREAERAEQREQLMNIREELRRAREEKERERKKDEKDEESQPDGEDGGGAADE